MGAYRQRATAETHSWTLEPYRSPAEASSTPRPDGSVETVFVLLERPITPNPGVIHTAPETDRDPSGRNTFAAVYVYSIPSTCADTAAMWFSVRPSVSEA